MNARGWDDWKTKKGATRNNATGRSDGRKGAEK
jgi:hypothetical protein